MGDADLTNRRRKRKKHVVMILYGSLLIDVRVKKEVKTLVSSNYRVTVLDTDLGLGMWNGHNDVIEVPIIQIPLEERTGFLSLLRFWIACFRFLLSQRSKIDIVHAHDLSGLPPASAYALLDSRVKLLYDSHELFPEAALDRFSIVHYVLFLALELLASRTVDRLITVSPNTCKILSKRLGIPTVLVRNVPDLGSSQRNIPIWTRRERKRSLRIAYSGTVLPGRGYEILPDAAEILETDLEDHFEFWIIGDGPFLPQLREIVKERNIETHFRFFGRIGFSELLHLTAECDIAIALYTPSLNNSCGLSNKLFEYMMIGIPFIFTDLTQSLPILERVGATVVENPVTGERIVAAITSLIFDSDRIDRMTTAGPKLIETKLNWTRESKRFLSVYDSLFVEADIDR